MLYQQQALDSGSTFEDNVLHAVSVPDGAILGYLDESGNVVPLAGTDLPSSVAVPFVPIAATATHPAFSDQDTLNRYLLGSSPNPTPAPSATYAPTGDETATYTSATAS